jgi:hypothetical protein
MVGGFESINIGGAAEVVAVEAAEEVEAPVNKKRCL